MKKKLADIEIPMVFHNYKIFKGNKEFMLKNSYIYFISGPNNTGKTSFKDAFAIIQSGKNDISEPVTRGENEGFIETKIPGADGRMYLIRHDFSDGKNKFVAIDEDGKKVSSVGEFRKLFNYTHFTAEEFFLWTNSADGRKKQRNIILSLLSEEDKTRYDHLCQDELVTYDERTKKGHEKDQLVELCKSSRLTEDQENSIEELPKLKSRLQDVQTKINNINTNAVKKDALQQRLKDFEIELHNQKAHMNNMQVEYDGKMSDLNADIDAYERKLNELKAKRSNLVMGFPEHVKTEKQKLASLEESIGEVTKSLQTYKEEDPAELNGTKTKIERAISDISVWEINKNNLETNVAKRDVAIRSYEEFTRNIEEIRAKKAQLIANADLGIEGISIEEDYVKIDGFAFKENQVSKSQAILLVSKLMCAINEAPIQVIGSANDLDWNILDQLYNIAQNRGKIMILDQVDRDATDIAVVAYEPKAGVVDTDTGEITQSPSEPEIPGL